MVVDQTNFVSIAILDLEGHTPVCLYSDSPEAFKSAFERMEVKSRQTHIIRFFSAVKNGEYVFELSRILSGHLAMIGLFKKAL